MSFRDSVVAFSFVIFFFIAFVLDIANVMGMINTTRLFLIQNQFLLEPLLERSLQRAFGHLSQFGMHGLFLQRLQILS
jgi:hypothetical protein